MLEISAIAAKALLAVLADDVIERLHDLLTMLRQSTLTKQLRELESDGLIHREIYREILPKVEYSLTDIGKSFVPILTEMTLWSQQWLCGRGGAK